MASREVLEFIFHLSDSIADRILLERNAAISTLQCPTSSPEVIFGASSGLQ